MKQNTKKQSRRPVRPNRITRNRVSWLLAPIPLHVRALIDREAAKWNIDLGQAVANLILRKAVAV